MSHFLVRFCSLTDDGSGNQVRTMNLCGFNTKQTLGGLLWGRLKYESGENLSSWGLLPIHPLTKRKPLPTPLQFLLTWQWRKQKRSLPPPPSLMPDARNAGRGSFFPALPRHVRNSGRHPYEENVGSILNYQ